MTSIRKLVKAGPASHTISLPKEWLEQHGVKTGDSLYVEETPDTLVVKTESRKVQVVEQECTIALDNKSDSSVQRELASAYVNNNRTIRFSGKSAESRLPVVRAMLQGFVALEITEQTPTVLVVRDLLDLEEISVEKTIRRMEMMVRTMLVECCNPDVQEQLRVKDEEVNKLYFLLVRLIRSALSVPGMAERFSLTPVKAGQVWFLITYLESLADYAQSVHGSFARTPKASIKMVKELVAELKIVFEKAMTSFWKKEKSSADGVLQSRQSLLASCTTISEHHKDAVLAEIAEQAKAIVSLILSIARLVIDE